MGDNTQLEVSPRGPLRVLVDTSVVLDLMLRREPWLTAAQPLLDAQAEGRVVGFVPASALTDIFYISRRLVGLDRAFEAVDRCLEDFTILPVDRAVLEAARRLPGSDFEDNVQIACAQHAGLDLIVTRDPAGFHDAPMPAVEPAEAARRATP